MRIKTAVAAALAVAVCVPGQQPSSPQPFGFPAASFADEFGNVLGDRVHFASAGTALRGDGALGERALHIDAELGAAGFAGKATLGGGEPIACSGRLDGEALLLRLGEAEWTLQSAVPLDDSLAELGDAEPDAARNWTVAVYMGGDNSLEDAAVQDLLEMQRGMPEHGCEVVVLIDRHKDDTDTADDWSDTRVLRVRPGGDGQFDTLGTPKERDTGSAVTLASFVAGAFRRYPARHHAVFVWDHGGGWTGICTDEDAPGAGGQTMLGLDAVRRGLRTGMAAAGVLRLDLLAFDACLMAQLDVALAMRDLAETMVASEAEVPGSGYPYDKVLPRFADDATGRAISQSIVGEYGTFSDDAFESGSTLAAFDLDRAAEVAQALDALARSAASASGEQWPAIARALWFAECYETRKARIADQAFSSIDLVDLAARLRGVPGIDAARIDALQQRIADFVIARYSGAERTLSHGLSIYGPHRMGQWQPAYDGMPLGRGNAWPALLRRVHELAAADASELAVADFRQLDALGQPSATARPFGGDRVLFTATGKAIVEVQVHDWMRDAANNRWLLLRAGLVTDPLWPARWATAAAADMIDLVMPQFESGRNELFHELAGLGFAITDGAMQTYGTLDFTAPSTQAPIVALARVTPKATGKPEMVEVSFDRAEWNVVALRPIGGAPGAAPRTLVPAAGDTFEFYLATRGDDGGEDGFFQAPLTWGDSGLALVAEADDPGKYQAEMIARTIDGRTRKASHDYEVAANPDLEAWPKSWEGFDVSRLAGTWKQFKVTGPQQYQDLNMTCEVAATDASNLFTVLCKGGPTGSEFETRQLWFFEWRSLPCLRVVTHVADGQKFGWYGPCRVGEKDGKLFLAMKAVNASGVVWEWRQQ